MNGKIIREKTARILVVDDTPANLQLLTNLLKEQGYTVHPASDGELALEFVHSTLPDLILLDIRMPRMDGYEVCRRLKSDERTRAIPVIFISVLEDQRDKVKGFREGAVDYITKPFQHEEVLARVGIHLRLRELTEQLEQKVNERTEELMNANQRLQQEIAERKAAEESLRKSEEKYRRIVDTASEGIWMLGPDLMTVYVNTQTAEMTGYSVEELLGRSFTEIMFAEDVPDHRKRMENRRRGIPEKYERRIRHKDGRMLWVYISASPVFDYEHRFTGTVAMFTDITERKQAEEQLQADLWFFESMNRINQAIQGTNDLEQMMSEILDIMLSIFGCDRAFLAVPCDPTMPEFRISIERTTPEYPGAFARGETVPMSPGVKTLFEELLSNPAPNEIYIGKGLDPDDVVWKTYEIKSQLAIAIYPKVGPPWECGLHQCSYNRVWTPQEKKLFLEISRRLADGLTSLLSHRDLKESEEKYRRIVDTANEGIWVLGPDTMTTFVNARMAEMLGYRTEEMLGRPLTDFMFEEDVRDHQQKMENRRAGISENYERRFLRKDGQTVWTLVSGTPIFDEKHRFQGAFGMHTDITERKNAEKNIALLSFALNNVSESAFLIDEKGRFSFVNEEACQVLHYACEELLAMGVSDIDPDFPMERWPFHWEELKMRGSLTFEGRHRAKDGTVFPVEINASYLEYDGQGYNLALVRDITERKKAEDALRLSQFIIDKASIGIIRGNGDARILSVNEHWARVLGYSQEELCTMTFFNIDTKLTPDSWQEHRNRLTSTGLNTFESVNRRKDGSTFPVEVTANYFKFGEQLFSCSFVRDITERKQAEKALRDSEELNRLTLSNITDAVFITDDAGAFIYICPNVDIIFGYSFHEVQAMGNIEYLLGKDLFSPAELEASQRLINIDREIRDASGATHALLVNVIRVSIKGGTRLYICRDITERKAAEESLLKLSAGIEQSPVSIIITNVNGTIEYVNPKFSEVSGYQAEEVLGKKPSILKSGITRPETYNDLWESITTGKVWQGTFCNRKKNGGLFWEEATITPVKDKAGSITHYIAINEDITEKRKLEDQLRHMQKMDAIGTLAGGVAHDFNNILTAITGYGSIIRMHMNPEDPQRSFIDQMLAAAERASHLTRALLAFSRKQAMILKPIDLNEVIRNFDKFLRRVIGEDVELNTPTADQKMMIMADAGQIEQVIVNLAANARDAMPRGGLLRIATEQIDMEERLGHGKSGRYAMITVSDTGIGMDEQTRMKIFEPFFTTKEVGRGTGLGLSIVYGIVKQHEGDITVYSEPGKGTTFRIYFPLIATGAEERKPEAVTPPAGGSETVLLAEDDEEIRNVDVTVLNNFGYRVIQAVDGEDALEKYKKHEKEIDLLVLDVIMPKKSGKDVSDAIKSSRPDVPVLFVSGYTADVLEKRGLFEGEEFLSKPVSPYEFLGKIRQLLDAAQRKKRKAA